MDQLSHYRGVGDGLGEGDGDRTGDRTDKRDGKGTGSWIMAGQMFKKLSKIALQLCVR